MYEDRYLGEPIPKLPSNGLRYVIMTLHGLLLELKILQDKIEKELAPVKSFVQLFPQNVWSSYPIGENETKHEYKHLITDKYYLLTLTFDSKIVCHLDEYGQSVQLKHCIDLIKKYHYFACYEKHMSGILHSHIMIRIEDYHEFQQTLHKMKKYLTTSVKLSPSINIKPIRDDSVDLWRSYSYIWDQKPDHPEFKYVIINI